MVAMLDDITFVLSSNMAAMSWSFWIGRKPPFDLWCYVNQYGRREKQTDFVLAYHIC